MADDQPKEISIEELLQKIEAARDSFATKNANRILLEQCRVAIIWLAQRVPDAQMNRHRSGLIMP